MRLPHAVPTVQIAWALKKNPILTNRLPKMRLALFTASFILCAPTLWIASSGFKRDNLVGGGMAALEHQSEGVCHVEQGTLHLSDELNSGSALSLSAVAHSVVQWTHLPVDSAPE